MRIYLQKCENQGIYFFTLVYSFKDHIVNPYEALGFGDLIIKSNMIDFAKMQINYL